MSAKIKNLYLVRHGETDWNRDKRFQGQTDIPLNELGREQAQLLNSKLEELKIEIAVSSNLTRAYETAQIATKNLKIPITQDPRFRETNIGEAEGLTYDELNEKFGLEGLEKWRSYDERDLDFRYPQGESKRELMYRVRTALLDVAQTSSHQNIAIFAHGMVMRALTFAFKQGVNWDLNLFSNGSIHHFVWEEKSSEFCKYLGKVN